MRKFLPYLAFGFLLFAAMSFYKQQNSSVLGVSSAQALPANIEGINLAEVKSFLNQDGPRILFLYASWCPYCHKQIEGFKYFLEQYPTDHILAVSTDKKPENFAQFVRKNGMPFTPYIYQDSEDLLSYLKQSGSSFGGGIPYFVVFQKGKYKQEFMGLTHPEKLAVSALK